MIMKFKSLNDDQENMDDAFAPHTDGVDAEHGFVTMLPLDEGVTLLRG